MNTDLNNPVQYHSLQDIRRRKEELLAEIKEDERKAKEKWKSLFKKPDALSASASPGRRLSSLLSNSVGVIDGAILGWKLYKKFKRTKR